ncbi:MAG: transporter substrate-binding domain-containing protein [Proteobacteria bacterium]|nr:transporter substrate-binding domain-containing protein [Pseudomonadota bacterium]
MTLASNKRQYRRRSLLPLYFGIFVLLFSVTDTVLSVTAADTETAQATEEKQGVSENQDISQQALDLSPEEQQWLTDHPEISVSNEFDWPPFDFLVSGTPQGFGIDLMNLLSQKSGVKFKYINGYTWDELVEMFFRGDIDLLHSLSITPDRLERAFFSPPYYHSKNVLILRRDTPDTHDLKDLEEKIIALPKGWSSIEFFRKHYPAVHIIEVESSRQALEYVDQGKVFATVEQEGIASYFIRKFGFTDLKLSKWIENDELQQTSSMHFAVRKQQPLLFSVLAKALATIQPEDFARLEQKWFSREGRQIGGEDVGLTPTERTYLGDKATISFCTAPDRMPLEAQQNGRATGMTSDLMEIFGERLGVLFTLLPTTSWQESLTAFKAGLCDVLPMVGETPEGKEYIDYTSSYLSFSIAIITREQHVFIGGLQDLAGKKVGVPEGDFVLSVAERKYPNVVFVRTADVAQCLLQLSSATLDAALLTLPVATYHIRHLGLTNLKVAGHSGLQDTIRIGIKKNDEKLHSVMSKVIRAIPTKEIDTVYQKWVTLTFDHRFDYSLLWKVFAAVGVLLVLIILWNRQLMKLNKQLALAHQALEGKSHELERIAVTDELTGLYNRRYLENTLVSERQRHLRYGQPMSVVMIDLDNFKRLNDTFGHQAGDTVLQKFAEILKTSIRGSDIAGRWGGEEFLIVCTASSLEGAAIQAEHLREKLAVFPFPATGRQTASFGVAGLQQGDSVDDLVRRADDALYVAKNKGRNRVERDGAPGR